MREQAQHQLLLQHEPLSSLEQVQLHAQKKTGPAYEFICGDEKPADPDELLTPHLHRARDLVSQARTLYRVLGLTPVLHSRLEVLAASVGLAFPPNIPLHAIHLRSIDPQWWARKLRRVSQRQYESAQVRAGAVGRGSQLYVSDRTLLQVQERRHQFREAAQSMFLVNDSGDVLPLDQAVSAGLANPRNRFADMVTRLRGMEEAADAAAHQAVFVTITCPSRFHASSDRYDGSTPADAQLYLTTLWARARAALQRVSVQPYGFRIAEPHHDGCPHWHLLLWVPDAEVNQLLAVLRRYALQDSPNEPGAAQHRMTVEHIDHQQGSAVGYLVKYLTKNLDGKSVSGASIGDAVDLDGSSVGDAVHAAERVQAWASCWGVRQFQQIGGAPVGPYRELRRVRDVIEDSPQLEALRQAADGGQWADYQALAQAYNPVLEKSCDALEALRQGDEARARSLLGSYGEPVFRVSAVLSGPERVATRAVRWVIYTVDEIADRAATTGSDMWRTALDAVRHYFEVRAAERPLGLV